MKTKSQKVVRKAPPGNNPLWNRFENTPPKKKNRFPRVAFVMQGGGSLGAYQCGVVKGLLEAGYEPDWIAATSIGAIQAAIIVGNPPEKRIEKLKQFWDKVAPQTLFDPLIESYATTEVSNKISSSLALFAGQPNFYYPRWWTEMMPQSGEPDSVSYYNTAPLRETLLELIDFDLLNSAPIRLSLGSVQISTGHLMYFNNINYRIEVDQIMASAALPPGFPAVKIDGELYWDGGVHSNSPLQVILEAIPSEDTLCFSIDCFGGKPFIPNSMNEISERMKDITYGTHSQRTILSYIQRHDMRASMEKISKILTPEQRKEHADILNIGQRRHCTIVHIAYSARIDKTASKDYNFGQHIASLRFEVGYQDVQDMLVEESKWGFIPADGKTRLYEAPNNGSQLLRKHNVI